MDLQYAPQVLAQIAIFATDGGHHHRCPHKEGKGSGYSSPFCTLRRKLINAGVAQTHCNVDGLHNPPPGLIDGTRPLARAINAVVAR